MDLELHHTRMKYLHSVHIIYKNIQNVENRGTTMCDLTYVLD